LGPQIVRSESDVRVAQAMEARAQHLIGHKRQGLSALIEYRTRKWKLEYD